MRRLRSSSSALITCLRSECSSLTASSCSRRTRSCSSASTTAFFVRVHLFGVVTFANDHIAVSVLHHIFADRTGDKPVECGETTTTNQNVVDTTFLGGLTDESLGMMGLAKDTGDMLASSIDGTTTVVNQNLLGTSFQLFVDSVNAGVYAKTAIHRFSFLGNTHQEEFVLLLAHQVEGCVERRRTTGTTIETDQPTHIEYKYR
mmetsp:Transcript_10951/g.27680  ORF Transcript_10951/g.27680 Transcript_10951/m.27680 type:complete len:203 (+) Transcript_10951:205-813(+)